MNSCVLMVEIYNEPQLRHTPDGLDVTDMIVHVPGLRADDPPHPLKVVGWGNLAKEIHQTYHQGDRIVIEGRLGMHTFDNPQGFKEKRAELTAQRIYPVGKNLNPTPAPATPAVARNTTPPEPVYHPADTYEPTRTTPTPATSVVNNAPPVTTFEPTYQPAKLETPSYPIAEEPDEDDIPF